MCLGMEDLCIWWEFRWITRHLEWLIWWLKPRRPHWCFKVLVLGHRGAREPLLVCLDLRDGIDGVVFGERGRLGPNLSRPSQKISQDY